MKASQQPDTSSMSGFEAFKTAYFNRPAIAMLLLGFGAGVPILLIFSSLGLWLREAGIDRTTVTMFSWAALGYSFKFIWSPLVDVLPLPILGKLGQRRSWLLLSQILIIIAIIVMAMTDPTGATLGVMAMGAVLLGFSAATQDIAIDAYRIESAPSEMQTALSASYVGGYRVGMIVSGAGALYLAEFFGSNEAGYLYVAWQKTYLIMACVMSVGVLTTLLVLREPVKMLEAKTIKTSDHARLVGVFLLSVVAFVLTYRFMGGVLPESKDALVGFLLGTVRFLSSGMAMFLVGYLLVQMGVVAKDVAVKTWVSPITDFFERYGNQAMMLLLLIGLYRISDIVAGNISNLFYQDLGFSKTQIANAVKVVGVMASIGGGFIGGWVAQKTGVMRAMMIGAILACITNLMFIGLFYAPSVPYLYGAVILDNTAAGLASAVFIAFLSALTSIRFTAVQYALFSSLMTLSPKILGGYSGAIVDAQGYPTFFMITFLIGIPVLYLVYWVHKKIPLKTDNV
ncbi:MAG: MFS transporter [Moraxella sp.]|nr:MFS transporter [Moraxella sp.]